MIKKYKTEYEVETMTPFLVEDENGEILTIEVIEELKNAIPDNDAIEFKYYDSLTYPHWTIFVGTQNMNKTFSNKSLAIAIKKACKHYKI